MTPEVCNAPGLTETMNVTEVTHSVNDDQVIVSEGGRLDAVIAPYWGWFAPAVISVSGCYANCGERDCRE